MRALRARAAVALVAAALLFVGCGATDTIAPATPGVAAVVPIDRFSDAFALEFRRSLNNTLPSPNQPIDFDSPRFLIEGFAPNGQSAFCYRLDHATRQAGTVYVPYRAGQAYPFPGQLPIVEDLPGDAGYSDLRRAVHVIVPSGYQANLFTSLSDIRRSGAALDTTDEIYNMPLVPAGSTAKLRLGSGADPAARRAWYRGRVAWFLLFEEPAARAVGLDSTGLIDTCTTFVCYAHDNPARGYMFEDDGVRTHNVHSTAPGQGAYTPLSHAVPYEGRWFNYVGNYATALVVPLGTPATSYENCPIVRVHGLATGR